MSKRRRTASSAGTAGNDAASARAGTRPSSTPSSANISNAGTTQRSLGIASPPHLSSSASSSSSAAGDEEDGDVEGHSSASSTDGGSELDDGDIGDVEPGDILLALRGQPVRDSRLQVISLEPAAQPVAGSGHTRDCLFGVSDGDFQVEAQAPPSDWPAMYDAGVNGLIDVGEMTLLDGMKVLLKGVAGGRVLATVVGQPVAFDLRPPRPVPGAYVRHQAGVTDDAAHGWEFVPPHDCHSECNQVEVDDGDDGYEVSPVAANSNGRCILERWPVPEFSTVEHADRGAANALEAVITPRVQRYALYYYYARTVYNVSGGGHRAVLPCCVVTAVRTKYPNQRGTMYCTDL